MNKNIEELKKKKKLISEIKKEIKDWGRTSQSKKTPKRSGEGFEEGWRLGINSVCNSIENIIYTGYRIKSEPGPYTIRLPFNKGNDPG